MSDSVPYLAPELQIGDYVLKSLIDTKENQQIWLGEQISVKREVELVCYHGPDPEQFISHIRVKAAVEDGVLGLVYEAVPTEDLIAFAREVLPERSLDTLGAAEEQLPPIVVNRIIMQVARELDSLEKKQIATRNFDGNDIRLTDTNQVRMHNIAMAGPLGDESASRLAFTEALRPLLRIGEPGATRMGTLLDYIKGVETQPAIPWSRTLELTQQVDAQLSAARDKEAAIPRTQPVMATRKAGTGVMVAGLLAGLLTLIFAFFVFRKGSPEIDHDRVVTVPAGRYPRPSGGVVELESFRIDANEVTIGQYSEFMDAWQLMDKKKRAKLWPKDVPKSKNHIRPQDWNDYYRQARTEQAWNGLQMSLECPVIGVDWWDANAYAKWKGAQLPTAIQWWAASSSGLMAREQSESWGPAGGAEDKIYGMQGLVSEWARTLTKNPAFPMESRKAFALGGSYKQPSKTALFRDWLESPETRRLDLGFRLVYSVEQ